MPRSSKDDWDTPGGPSGRDALAGLQASTPGGARALHNQWRTIMGALAPGRILKVTVSPQLFNTFRRRRLDEGVTDEQLVDSFHAFALAIENGFYKARHGDLWFAYANSWARWVSYDPAPAEGPLTEPERSPRRQR